MASLLTPQGKQQAKALGTDPADPDYAPKVLAGARSYGERAEQVAHQDIEKAVDLFSRESISESEQLDLIPWKINSFVVKLNSGSLLLYAPVRIRDELGFADWLDGLGRGSSIRLFTPSLVGFFQFWPVRFDLKATCIFPLLNLKVRWIGWS